MKNIIQFIFISTTLTLSTVNAGLVENSPIKKGRMSVAPKVNAGKTECVDKVPRATNQFLFNYFTSVAKTDYATAQAGVERYSKMIGKIYKESSGNPVAYSDMKGAGSIDAVRAFYRNGQKASIDMFHQLRKNDNVTRTHQTNIGLLQISPDQLFWRAPVRKLFNETIQRFNQNPKEGLKMCGTRELFANSEAELLKEFDTFRNCSVGRKTQIINKKTVPILSDDEFKCFDRWASFCPSLNIAIGLKLPMAYFETRGASPLCKQELDLLLTSIRLNSENFMDVNKHFDLNFNTPMCI